MRYHQEKPELYYPVYGRIYICDHPVYNRCTLFEEGEKGLAVIQQRYDPDTKHTWWEEIDPWLNNIIFTAEKFSEFFEKYSGPCEEGLYPTVTVRQLMWYLRLKPIKVERWNTTFDHKNI